MSRLVLHLFGSPRMEIDRAPVEVDTRKATALMAYLVITGETHQRERLAALLWPEYDHVSARAALRRTLSTLNGALNCEYLSITRESVGLVPGADLWLDVKVFRGLLEQCKWHGHGPNEICAACLEPLAAAVRVYREPFMAGFSLRDSPNFEEWQFFQEEALRHELLNALEKLVRGLSARGQIEEALQYARRWLALDPLMEEAHRELMRLYARSGRRSAALRQYHECARILNEELGVTPMEETTRLYEAIMDRQAKAVVQSPAVARLSAVLSPARSAPARPSPALFAEPDERLRFIDAPVLGKLGKAKPVRVHKSIRSLLDPNRHTAKEMEPFIRPALVREEIRKGAGNTGGEKSGDINKTSGAGEPAPVGKNHAAKPCEPNIEVWELIEW